MHTSETKSSSSSLSSEIVYDLESQSSSPVLQRTLDAIGDQTALIIEYKTDKTTLTSRPLKVQYELTSTSNWKKFRSFTRITRRKAKEEPEVLIAEWESNTFGTDMLRFPSSGTTKEFFPAKSYLRRDGWFGYHCSFCHRFEANGRAFVWRTEWLSEFCSMRLYPEGNDEHIARTFGRRWPFRSRLAYIEVLRDKDIMDQLVVTWAIARQRRSERAAIFNIVHALLIDCLLLTLLKVYVWSEPHP